MEYGVCGACQKAQPVRKLITSHVEVDSIDVRVAYEPEDEYVVLEHDFPYTNSPCNGAGTTPEVLV